MSPPLIHPPISPRVPGTLQAINFHLTNGLSLVDPLNIVRVYGPIPTTFIIRQVWINAVSNVQDGHFLNVLVAGDSDTTQTATPTGESIFPLLVGAQDIAVPDNQRGIAIPPAILDLKMAYRVDATDRWIKLHSYATGTLTTLPNIHVTVVIERMDLPGQEPIPIDVRPPVVPPVEEPPDAFPTPDEPVPYAPAPYWTDYSETRTTAPAWRIAAQGLARTLPNLLRGLSHQIDAYGAWSLDHNSATAAPFRARIETILQMAGKEGGDYNTHVPIHLRLDPFA